MGTFKQLSTTQTFVGLSTETKPTSGVNYGARFYEVNSVSFKVDKIFRYVPDSDGAGTSGWVQSYEDTNDANLQVNHAAVSNANPVPISDAGGSVTVDGPLTDTELRASDVPVTLDGEAVVLDAGTAIVGKVGIDQTTDGTTNKVQARNATHGDFQANVTIQLADTDVSATNPVPVYTLDNVYEATLTLDTNAYGADELLADTQILDANAFPANGGKLTVLSVNVMDLDDNKGALDIVLLRSNTSLGTENSTPNIADGNIDEILDVISINATDYKDLGGASWASVSVGRIIKAASDATALYIGAISRDTKTYTASGLVVRVGVIGRSA